MVDSKGLIPISLGGTGGKTAAEARNNFGLGWWATSDPANLINVNSSLSSSSNPFAGIGFYNSPSAGGPTTYGVALQMYLKGGGGISITQEAVGSVANQVRLFARNMAVDSAGNTTFGNYVTIRHSGNTTVATDGTLKAASPVVKILNDGTYETNEEAEGVTVTRLGVGQYLIEGCEALNSDAAWGGIDGGFDIPTDRNKQPLIWLDYKVNADGSVLVKTYHRTHPGAPAFAKNEIEGVSDGEPVDIPSDQFVSIRVQMPSDSPYNRKQALLNTEKMV